MNNYYFVFPNLKPIIFTIGPFSLSWYGMTYFLSFLFALYLGKKYANNTNNQWNNKIVENLIYSAFFGLYIGGRIGYIIFYNANYYFNSISNIFKIWEGGMSFHGGLIGIIIIIFYFSKKIKKHFLEISDFLTLLIPFGLGIGRIGNFINGELWGRVSSNIFFSILFPESQAKDLKLVTINPELQCLLNKLGVLPRHPSQIYESFLEGVILFIILYLISKILKKPGDLSATFLIVYGLLRFIIEFFREPDPQIGLFQHIISMGQILSTPMIIIGMSIIIYNRINFYKFLW
ncbi:MAG TPA: prolipoprotein diacylglyceryl transferase [Buchnera sp. (in: enterobacteria)]|nr:prolipoprotein diacylglyceryl transferase [Buchnera sp. (in: enterobacteria)]